MRITVNLQGTGAGDNGGTATLFHSANALHRLGHEVNVVSDIENKFTWFGLQGPNFVRTHKEDYPDADILIASGCGSVKRVLTAPKVKGSKVWWVRGHETWIMKGNELQTLYLNPHIRKVVNSVCLQKFLKRKTGLVFPVVRPGMDLEVFKPLRVRNWEEKSEFIIGTLYSEKKTKRFKWLGAICKGLKNSAVDFRLKLFGTFEAPVGFKYDEYLYKPSQEGLCRFYNNVDFWIAPTESEGLHIPPQEAILCGCVVIGAIGELNGMSDYLDNQVTGFTLKSPEKVVELISSFYHNLQKRKRLGEVSEAAIAKVKSLGDRKRNMSELVYLFRSFVEKDRRKESLDLRRMRR